MNNEELRIYLRNISTEQVTFSLESTPSEIIITIEGILDLYSLPLLKEFGETLLKEIKEPTLILKCERVSYFHKTVFGLFFSLASLFKEKGISLSINLQGKQIEELKKIEIGQKLLALIS